MRVGYIAATLHAHYDHASLESGSLYGKPGWDSVIPSLDMYTVKDTDHVTPNLVHALRSVQQLTLTLDSYTGFREIGTLPFNDRLDMTGNDLKNPTKVQVSDKTIAHSGYHIIEQYLERMWSNKHPHLIHMSGGKDSRVIAYALKQLERKHGEAWLGKVMFVHHHEGATDGLIHQLMPALGWRDDQYHIHREGRWHDPDYFDWPMTTNANSYFPPMFRWWSDVVPLQDERKWVVVNGWAGNWLGRSGHGSWGWYGKPTPHFGEYYAQFHDVILPYISWDLVRLNMSIPDNRRNFSAYPNKLRTLMLQDAPDFPYHSHHAYQFENSDKRAAEIQGWFEGSKLWHDHPAVRKIDIDYKRMYQPRTLGHKVLGLATVYERV